MGKFNGNMRVLDHLGPCSFSRHQTEADAQITGHIIYIFQASEHSKMNAQSIYQIPADFNLYSFTERFF